MLETLFSLLAVAVLLFGLLVWTIHIVASVSSYFLFKNPARFGEILINDVTNLHRLPGVSILKPLKGLDANLYENLESFFKLQYPAFELLFCVADATDPALGPVRQLMAKYPKVSARIFTEETTIGINPKLCNIYQAYGLAQYDCVWISDCSVIVQPLSLAVNVHALLSAPNVGLVHQLPSLVNPLEAGGQLEAMYFATMHARVYVFASLLGMNCANGMSFLFKRSILEQVGGLQAFAQYIAEDYFMGQAIFDAGYKIRMSREPAYQNFGPRTVDSFFARQVRWARLRKTMMPGTTMLEPFMMNLFQACVAALSLWYLFAVSPMSYLPVHLLMWFALDMFLCNNIDNSRTLTDNSAMFSIAMWIACELTVFPLFVCAMLDNKIAWRDSCFKLQQGGLGVVVPDEESPLKSRLYAPFRKIVDVILVVLMNVAYVLHRSTRNGQRVSSDKLELMSGSGSLTKDAWLAFAAGVTAMALTYIQYH